jgi:hypothetical protein
MISLLATTRKRKFTDCVVNYIDPVDAKKTEELD